MAPIEDFNTAQSPPSYQEALADSVLAEASVRGMFYSNGSPMRHSLSNYVGQMTVA